MNFRAGGAQPRMRDGWYLKDGERVTHPMVYAQDHPEHPNQPKGMKAVLTERGLWRSGLQMKCKGGCKDINSTCCATRILEQEADFLEQKSRVQEIIEGAGEPVTVHYL